MADPEPVERKVCHVCGSSLPVSAFWPDKRLPGGLAHRCKRCDHPAVFGMTLPRGVARKKSNRQSLVCKYGIETVEMLECEYAMEDNEDRYLQGYMEALTSAYCMTYNLSIDRKHIEETQ